MNAAGDAVWQAYIAQITCNQVLKGWFFAFFSQLFFFFSIGGNNGPTLTFAANF